MSISRETPERRRGQEEERELCYRENIKMEKSFLVSYRKGWNVGKKSYGNNTRQDFELCNYFVENKLFIKHFFFLDKNAKNSL